MIYFYERVFPDLCKIRLLFFPLLFILYWSRDYLTESIVTVKWSSAQMLNLKVLTFNCCLGKSKDDERWESFSCDRWELLVTRGKNQRYGCNRWVFRSQEMTLSQKQKKYFCVSMVLSSGAGSKNLPCKIRKLWKTKIFIKIDVILFHGKSQSCIRKLNCKHEMGWESKGEVFPPFPVYSW